MKTAILYIRVSTDEQALKGYSQRSQEERLRKFCKIHNIRILLIIYEDHSAKTFKRPEWSKFMILMKQNKLNRPDLLLFTRWDRFSRNTTEAYKMLCLLKNLGLEPQAIDQPLDMNVPENKTILAVYIATAEVENDRRSLNIKYGVYRAKEEGRWLGPAPLGFIKRYTESGKRIIVPHEPEAMLIKKAFNRISERSYTIRWLYKQSVAEGLRCSLNAFWGLIRNPVYCGCVRVPAFEDMPAHQVKLCHEPIVTEELFNKVQAILKNGKRQPYSNRPINDLLPLRGFLYCPNCCKKLSGSGSSSRLKRYYYYHCYGNCGYRVRADRLNLLFCEGIDQLVAGQEYTGLYKEILQDTFHELHNKQSIDQAYITRTIEKLIERSSKAKELLIRGDIDDEDYLAIRDDCEKRINSLGAELHDAYAHAEAQKHGLEQEALQISLLGPWYEHADLITKRKLASLLLAPKLIFNQTRFNLNLSTSAQIIYGVVGESNCISQTKEELKDSDSDAIESMDSTKCNRIIKIESKKGNIISNGASKEILHYLQSLAKITQNVL